jgi:uncharacterized protein (DUF697 family)
MKARKIIMAGITGLVVATIVNGITFYIGKAAGFFPETVMVPNTGQPISIAHVIFSSVFTAIGATGLFLMLIKFLGAKAVNVFRIISVIFLLVSFGGPFSIPNAPTNMTMTLSLMHVFSGVVLIYFLTVKGVE